MAFNIRTGDWDEKLLSDVAETYQRVITVEDHALAGGFGSALVPESVLNFQLPDVVFRPLVSEIEAMIDLHCVYRKDESSPLLASLLDCVYAYRQQNLAMAGRSSLAQRQ